MYKKYAFDIIAEECENESDFHASDKCFIISV